MNGQQLLSVASDRVDAVLLSDGWHKIALGSFSVGPIGFGDGDQGSVLGYSFEEISNTSLHVSAMLAGPLDAVLAVRQVPSRRPFLRLGAVDGASSENGFLPLRLGASRDLN